MTYELLQRAMQEQAEEQAEQQLEPQSSKRKRISEWRFKDSKIEYRTPYESNWKQIGTIDSPIESAIVRDEDVERINNIISTGKEGDFFKLQYTGNADSNIHLEKDREAFYIPFENNPLIVKNVKSKEGEFLASELVEHNSNLYNLITQEQLLVDSDFETVYKVESRKTVLSGLSKLDSVLSIVFSISAYAYAWFFVNFTQFEPAVAWIISLFMSFWIVVMFSLYFPTKRFVSNLIESVKTRGEVDEYEEVFKLDY